MTTEQKASRATRVCLVEHNPLAASYLRQLLADENAFRLFTREEILERPGGPRASVEVFVLDRETLPEPLSKFVRELRTRFSGTKTLVLGEPAAPEEISRLLFLGIQGFLSYDEIEDLPSAIQAVAQGQLWVAPAVLRQYERLAGHLSHKGQPLTRREQHIVALVRRRLSNKEISAILKTSERTVKFHLTNIFLKLGVRDRESLAELAAARLDPLRPENSS